MHYTHNWLKRNPENYSVFYRLLSPKAQTELAVCFQFLRGIEELSKDTHSTELQRKQRLEALEKALASADEGKLPPFAIAFSRLAPPRSAMLSCARDLLSCYVQDLLKTRYHDYRDLQDYCLRNTLPLARALLIMVAGEEQADMAALGALSMAVEILGHIQKAGDDYVNRDRVYLPLDWFTFAEVPLKALASSETSPGLRLVFDRALDNCVTLLAKAKPLAKSVKDRKARLLAAFIFAWAVRLQARLRKRDPLARRIKIGKLGLYWCLLKARLSV